MERVMKYTGHSGRVIFFEPGGELPENFIEGKRFLNSRFLKTGFFELMAFSMSNVVSATGDETEMYLQLKGRSVHLIGKNYE